MFEINSKNLNYHNQDKFWAEMGSEIQGMLVPEIIPNLANIAASIFNQLPDLNWCGFYLFDGQKLVLGPFQGKPACIYIPLDKGVCGKAAKERKTVIVPDVDQFPGHIVCDAASKSEIVIPIVSNTGELVGVLDLDSPKLDRFKDADRIGFEKIIKFLEQTLNQ